MIQLVDTRFSETNIEHVSHTPSAIPCICATPDHLSRDRARRHVFGSMTEVEGISSASVVEPKTAALLIVAKKHPELCHDEPKSIFQ